MAAGATAIRNEEEMLREVGKIVRRMGLEIKFHVPLSRTIWNMQPTKGRLDAVVTEIQPDSSVPRKRFVLECVFQGISGTAYQKVPDKLEELRMCPLPGVLVYDGEYMERVAGRLAALGAIHISELEQYLRLVFDFEDIGGSDEP